MFEAQFGEKFRAELHELLSWRRDVRRFRPDDLPDGTFERLVQIACLAPSVGLSQPWRFVAVRSQSCRDAIRACFESCNAERCDPRREKERRFTRG